MNKGVDFVKCVRLNFQNSTIAVLILLYIWWFRLNPFAFGPGEQASDPLIFGLILLFIYVFVIGRMKFSHEDSLVRAHSYGFAVLLFAINALFLFVYLPRVRASAHFGNTTYYITSNFPFLECCGYHQFTEWQGIHYDSDFFAYSLPPVKFIYDEKSSEVSLVDISENSERLYVTLGQPRRYYDGYAKLEHYLYYISAICNRNGQKYCDTWSYFLYRCELDNKLCTRLPIEYTDNDDDFVILEANEMTGDIEFYLETYFGNPKELIFTYGEHPRCFVEGCSVLEK